MEQFNKALSFILGLVVVAVFIIFASGKFNIKGLSIPKASTAITGAPNTTPQPTSKPWFSFSQPKVTPTPTTIKAIAQNINSSNKGSTQAQNQNYHSYTSVGTPQSIPNTGVPIVMFPLLGTSLLSGIFIKKSGKRD